MNLNFYQKQTNKKGKRHCTDWEELARGRVLGIFPFKVSVSPTLRCSDALLVLKEIGLLLNLMVHLDTLDTFLTKSTERNFLIELF
jgi:hypothetical protein